MGKKNEESTCAQLGNAVWQSEVRLKGASGGARHEVLGPRHVIWKSDINVYPLHIIYFQKNLDALTNFWFLG